MGATKTDAKRAAENQGSWRETLPRELSSTERWDGERKRRTSEGAGKDAGAEAEGKSAQSLGSAWWTVPWFLRRGGKKF